MLTKNVLIKFRNVLEKIEILSGFLAKISFFSCEICEFVFYSDLRYFGDPNCGSQLFQLRAIKPGELDEEPTVDEVLENVRRIVNGKYLIGHGMVQDIMAMEYFIPPYQGLRDTGKYLAWGLI